MNTEIKVGDRIRSYDFDNNKDCYITGTVTAIGRARANHSCAMYSFICEEIVWCGEVDNSPAAKAKAGETFYAPINGTPSSSGGVCNRVEKIEAEAAKPTRE